MKTLKAQTFIDTNIDPFQSFLSLKKSFPKAFFFQVKDRLSLIGLRPSEVIRANGTKTHVVSETGSIEHDENILNYVSTVLAENQFGEVLFPFQQGGLFGCLGHDTVALIEDKIPLGPIKAELFLVRDLVVFDHEKNEIHFVSSGIELSKNDLRGGGNDSAKIPTLDRSGFVFERESFLASVDILKTHIRQGNIFQAVLSQGVERRVSSSALEIYKNVRRLGESAYSFFFDFETSSFFGASPESLITLQKRNLITHPIAGTKPRGKNETEDSTLKHDLETCPKESAEHLMLVDLARNDLGRVSVPGSVNVSKFRTLLKLPNVMHLVSEVTGVLKDNLNAVDAFRATFPAGTLSGAPKIRALQILSEVESSPRGFYGGSVVAFDFGGNLESCIAIRAIEVKNHIAMLRAGAGIVADSHPEREFEEIQHKLTGMMTAINISEASL